MSMSDLSLSDIAAVTEGNNNNDGWGNGGWWIILLFIILGWGRNGWGNDGDSAMQGALTRGDLCMDMNFQEVKREIQNANDAVNLGFANLNSTICQQQYDTAQMFNASNVANLQGFNALQSQLANCCCDLREQVANVNYNMATNTCAITTQIQNSTRDIVDATNAGTQAILTQMCNDKIANLENENAALRLSASQTAQNQYLISQLRPSPEPAYIVQNPYCGCGGYNAYNGCGC